VVRAAGAEWENCGQEISAHSQLTDIHKEFRAAVRQLAEARIAPTQPLLTGRIVPVDGFQGLCRHGAPYSRHPRRIRRAGADHVTQAIMVEELARACASTSVTLLISPSSAMIPYETGDRRS